jgi:predicted molibdopterin-dependent oxidoreductase YjgC
MLIRINGRETETDGGVTLWEAARSVGFDIPAMCYAPGAVHKASCMVCVVKNCATGEIVPSCSTMPTEGMEISTEDEEVKSVRRLSLELLLSDHRADCDAPCTSVCPHGLDVEMMLRYLDEGRREKAAEVVAAAFDLPETECDGCKAPCEKACRRKLTGGGAVEIRAIVRELAAEAVPVAAQKITGREKAMFQSRLGALLPDEVRRIGENTDAASGCLHCACRGREKCTLRALATAEGIKRTRYNLSSSAPVMYRERVGERTWFEPSKCVRCGLCVYNTCDGFTFSGRGFTMQIVLPEESRANISEETAGLCPTGAIYTE